MIGDRIKEIRMAKKLNQVEFAKRLNLSQSAVANYENNSRVPIDAIIGSICREFNVNEAWLRTGEGEMFIELDDENYLMEWAGRVLASQPEDFRRRFVKALMTLDENEWKLLENVCMQIVGSKGDEK